MAINLGDINFGLGPDTRRLESARREVLRFGQAVNQAATAQGQGARETEAQMRRQEKAIVDTLNKILKLNDAIRHLGIDRRYLNNTTNLFNRLVTEMGRGQVTALQFQRSMEDVATSLGRAQRAVKQNVEAQKALERQHKEAAQASRVQEQYILKLEKTMHHAKMQVEQFQASLAKTRGAPSGLGGNVNKAFAVLQNSLKGSMLDPVAFQRASQQFQANMARNTNALVAFRRHGDQSQLAYGLERLANVSILLHGPLSGIASRLALVASVSEKVNLATAAMVVGISAGALAFVQMGRAALDATKIFQRASLGLEAVYGSSQLTAGTMDYLMDVADRSGRSFADISGMFTRITAASKGTNLEGERTRFIFERILFAGAKMGATNDEITGSLRAMEQIMSKGSVQAEELRGQLGDRLPGAFNIMADALGVSTAKLNDMMKQGQITSDALLPFAEELAKRYGVDVTQAINTTASAEGRLYNAFLRFGKAADDAVGFSDAYVNALGGITKALDYLGKNFDSILKLIGSAGIALAMMYAPAVIGGFFALAAAIKGAALAMLGLNAAAKGNVLARVAMLVANLTLLVMGWVVGQEIMNSLLGEGEKSTDGFASAIEQNEAALNSAATASSTFRKELAQQIKMQKQAAQAALAEAHSQLIAAKAKVESMRAGHTGGLFDFLYIGERGKSLAFQNAEAEAKAFETSYSTIVDQIKVLSEQLSTAVSLPGTSDNPIDPLGGGDGSGAGASRVAKATREAAQAIGLLTEQYNILGMSPGLQEYAKIQAKIVDDVQNFKDRLIDAKVPMEDVNRLTREYAAALTLVEEKQYRMQYFPDFWVKMSEVLSTGMDSAMNALIDAWSNGEDALESLRDVGKQVAMDLLKTFAQLAILNPLKNMLFGMSEPVFGTANGGGMGGLFGGLLGGIFGGGQAAPANSFMGAFNSKLGFAGGGSFRIGGNKSTGGLDDQLVSFYGKRGETVSVGKAGHGSTGGGNSGDFIFEQHFHNAAGNEEVARIARASVEQGIAAYDGQSTGRQARNAVRGRTRRVPGLR